MIIAYVKGEAPRHLTTKILPHLKNILWREAIRKTLLINNTLSDVKFEERTQDLIQRNKKRIESCPA